MKIESSDYESKALKGAAERASRRPNVRAVKQAEGELWDHGDDWLGDWGRHDNYPDITEYEKESAE